MTRIVLDDVISDPTHPTDRALAPLNPTHLACGLVVLIALGAAVMLSTDLSGRSPPIAPSAAAPVVAPVAVHAAARDSTGRAHLATATPGPRQVTLPLASTGRAHLPMVRPAGGMAQHGHGYRDALPPLPVLGPGR
jgi:hypothetical protein